MPNYNPQPLILNYLVRIYSHFIIISPKKSTKMSEKGYKKDRFPNLLGQMFDCMICQGIVKAPKECQGCGNLFCNECITNYTRQNSSCPNRCGVNDITNMSARALINIYNDLDIKCSKCAKTMKLGEIEKHQEMCGRPKCAFFESCEGFQAKKDAAFAPFCSEKCKLLSDIVECKGDNKKVYDILQKFSSKVASMGPVIGGGMKSSQGGLVTLKWNAATCGMNIAITNDQTTVFLKEEAYVFRTVVVGQAFMSGRHYWEIHADGRTENELKIGVTASNIFDFNTAFCDHKFGFAYYGLGQLRHGSNATGSQYGKRFKKTGILGVYLNMEKGTLSFSLNGEDLGEAYQDSDLKKGPLYATVALLHCSGCTIKGELPIPGNYTYR